MNRGPTGDYLVTSHGDEEVRAFVPRPLPPEPPLRMTGPLQVLLEEATHALGRLDGAASLLPDPGLFIYSYVRKEAVLSSQIEGTQSSLSDLLRFESARSPGAPLDDLREVSRYVAAVDHATTRLAGQDGLPLCNRLLREAHQILLTDARGGHMRPGEFRRSQNWIGGTRPGNAAFVPPPPAEAAAAMSDLERFVHAVDDGLPALVRAGLAHVQFETIHPFMDGNGRTGRMLIILMLIDRGLLSSPVLYLSLYFKKHRDRYYDLLGTVRRTGDWESWLEFFLEGVAAVATSARETAQRLLSMASGDRSRIAASGRGANSALRIHEALAELVVVNVARVVERTGLSAPTVGTGLQRLCDLDIATEVTGGRRNRVFVYREYLAVLDEGTEPLASTATGA